MSGPIIHSGDFPRSQMPGVRKWFNLSYNRYPDEYTNLFEVLQSDKAFEEDMSTHGFSNVSVIPQGTDVKYESVKQGPVTRYQHVKFGKGYVLTEEMIDDNQYPELIRSLSGRMGVAIKQTKEQYHANIINNCTSSSKTGYDGVALASTSHALLGGGTMANMFSVVTPLSELSLSQAITNIEGFVDDSSQKLQAMATGLHIPKELRWEAMRILKSMGRPGTANNDMNVMEGMMPSYVNHFFTSATRWLVTTNVQDGLISFQRKPLTITDSQDFNSKNARYSFTERYCAGWSDYRCAWFNGE